MEKKYENKSMTSKDMKAPEVTEPSVDELDPTSVQAAQKRRDEEKAKDAKERFERAKAAPGSQCPLCGGKNVTVSKSVEELPENKRVEHAYVKCNNPKCKYVAHYKNGKLT